MKPSELQARARGLRGSTHHLSGRDGSTDSHELRAARMESEPGQEALEQIAARLGQLEALLCGLCELVQGRALTKDYYTTAEAAKILGKRPFTVREWCRLGRIRGEKAAAGRGVDAEWRISQAELQRIQNEGLLPLPAKH